MRIGAKSAKMPTRLGRERGFCARTLGNKAPDWGESQLGEMARPLLSKRWSNLGRDRKEQFVIFPITPSLCGRAVRIGRKRGLMNHIIQSTGGGHAGKILRKT